jgi:hypothetical protein
MSTDEIERRMDEAPLLAATVSKNAIFFSLGDAIGEMLPTLEESVIWVSRSLLDVDDASSSMLAVEDPDDTLEAALRWA